MFLKPQSLRKCKEKFNILTLLRWNPPLSSPFALTSIVEEEKALSWDGYAFSWLRNPVASWFLWERWERIYQISLSRRQCCTVDPYLHSSPRAKLFDGALNRLRRFCRALCRRAHPPCDREWNLVPNQRARDSSFLGEINEIWLNGGSLGRADASHTFGVTNRSWTSTEVLTDTVVCLTLEPPTRVYYYLYRTTCVSWILDGEREN